MPSRDARNAHVPTLPPPDADAGGADARDDAAERAWDHLAKAMAEYRGEQFEACIDEAGKAVAGLGRRDGFGEAAAKLFMAMAHHRLGRQEAARSILEEVVRWAEHSLPKAGGDDLGVAYNVENWLILHVALREAESLIRNSTPATRRSGN